MSLCTINKWGTGTTREKSVDTEAALEFKQRLASIQAERARQDSKWDSPTESSETTLTVKKEEEVPKKINSQIKTSKEIHTLADLKAERERQDLLWQ
jgi:hypothetical protein